MNSEWIVPLLAPLLVGLALGGVLSGVLGKRVDPSNPPVKPSVLARTAMWFGISAVACLVVPGFLAGPVLMLLPQLGTTTILVIAVGPALLAYAAASAAVVMAVTAVMRRDRRYATWVALAAGGVPFLLMTVIAVGVLVFGVQF